MLLPKNTYLIDRFKKITKSYCNKYINSVSKIENENLKYNYLVKDVINLIKNMLLVYFAKGDLDLDTLIQYINKEGN